MFVSWNPYVGSIDGVCFCFQLARNICTLLCFLVEAGLGNLPYIHMYTHVIYVYGPDAMHRGMYRVCIGHASGYASHRRYRADEDRTDVALSQLLQAHRVYLPQRFPLNSAQQPCRPAAPSPISNSISISTFPLLMRGFPLILRICPLILWGIPLILVRCPLILRWFHRGMHRGMHRGTHRGMHQGCASGVCVGGVHQGVCIRYA